MLRLKRIALNFPYVSVNPPKLKLWLPFDIDASQGGLSWEAAAVAMPNVSVVNKANGHAHLLYGLEAPVACSEAARIAPLRYLAAVEKAYLAKLEPFGADAGFAGLMVKNPTHSHWNAFWGRLSFWSLEELASYVELDKFTPKHASDKNIQLVGVNRNVTLFNELGPEGKWAYSEVRKYRSESSDAWFEAVLEKALEMNGEFPVPMSFNEVKAIAKSVSSWTRKHDKYAHQKFLARQSFKGKRSGEARLLASTDKRATALIMHAKGMYQKHIAAELEVSERTIRNWLSKSGNEPKSDIHPAKLGSEFIPYLKHSNKVSTEPKSDIHPKPILKAEPVAKPEPFNKYNTIADLNGAVIINNIHYTLSPAGYLLFEGKPLGGLKYGHPALISALGEQYASREAFEHWLKNDLLAQKS